MKHACLLGSNKVDLNQEFREEPIERFDLATDIVRDHAPLVGALATAYLALRRNRKSRFPFFFRDRHEVAALAELEAALDDLISQRLDLREPDAEADLEK